MNIITDIEKIDRSLWRNFVDNHPYGNIFQTPEMYFVYKNTRNYEPVFIAIEDRNIIIATLLAVIQKENIGVMGKLTARSIISGGPLINLDRTDVLPIILKEYIKYIGSRVIYTQIRNFFDQRLYIEIFKNNKFIYEDHLNIILNINIGEAALFDGFSKSRKKGIRKALKEQFVFDVIDNVEFVDEFYNLLTTSYNRIKLPIPTKMHFNYLCSNLSAANYQMFSLKINSELVVALFALIYKNTLYGYYMGANDNPEIFKMKPIDLFFWEVFKWAVNNNIQKFDWMGAGKPGKEYGVRDFKIQFGGELVNFGRYELHHKPILYKIGKIGFQIYKKIK